jgi:hypothetical protein
MLIDRNLTKLLNLVGPSSQIFARSPRTAHENFQWLFSGLTSNATAVGGWVAAFCLFIDAGVSYVGRCRCGMCRALLVFVVRCALVRVVLLSDRQSGAAARSALQVRFGADRFWRGLIFC